VGPGRAPVQTGSVRRDVLEVLDPGVRATFQDAGRPGHAASGVGPSGAADLAALRLANRLVGADETAPAVETVVGGLVVEARRTVRVAVTGAPRSVRVDGRLAAMWSPLTLRAGERLRIEPGHRQVFTYLAVDGGFVAESVLGSASTDSLTGLGPPPLERGDVLASADRHSAHAAVDVAPVDDPPDPAVLAVHPGPRTDWFAPGALDALCAATWHVAPTSNRIGLRLDGPSCLHRTRLDELPSEGVVRGSVQITPDGTPVVFGPDHPVTGGYPVLAVVDGACLAAAAQCEPGSRVRFRRAR
jgi:biotin-dependent carboxylase-like uncharacterized protein